MERKKTSKLLSIGVSMLTAMAVLSGAIAVPILCRPFYYAHINPLHLTLKSRLSSDEMKVTYNEIIDYCLGQRDVFSLTYLPWSAEGASHFADVRTLFLLDLWVAAVSIGALVLLLGICLVADIRPHLFRGHTPGFWAAGFLLAGFSILGIFAAMNFDQAFEVFHTVFFPGKENWIFDYRVDPVILILPQTFFRNCAILIFGVIAACCSLLIAVDQRERKRKPADG